MRKGEKVENRCPGHRCGGVYLDIVLGSVWPEKLQAPKSKLQRSSNLQASNITQVVLEVGA
jgi:hypothetical protein